MMYHNTGNVQDTQTTFIYKNVVDDVIRLIRRDLKEEIDENSINLLKINWEVKLTNILKKQQPVNVPTYQPRTIQKSVTVVNNTNLTSYPAFPPKNMSEVKVPEPGLRLMSQGSASLNNKLVKEALPALTTKFEPQKRGIDMNVDSMSIKKIPPTQIKKIIPPKEPSSSKLNLIEQSLQNASNPPIIKPKPTPTITTTTTNPSSNTTQNTQKRVAQTKEYIKPKKHKIQRLVQLDGSGIGKYGNLTDTEDESLGQDSDEKSSNSMVDMTSDLLKIDDEGNVITANAKGYQTAPYGKYDNGPELHSEDDISEDLEFNENTPNVLVGRFEKILRKKSQWKIEFRYGIITINGVDIVFNKAIAEFTF